MHDRLNLPYNALRITFGLVPLLAGLDKFVGLLADWEAYLSPWVAAFIPASVFMKIVGVIEIAAGAAVLAGLVRIGGYVVAAWLVAIALNLLTTGQFFDIAVRDLAMAVGAFTMARMAEARQESAVAHPLRAGERAA